MQSFTDFADSTQLNDSRVPLLNNDKTIMSCNAGVAFPTTNLQVGMLCHRTDQGKTYELMSTGPEVWVLIADLNKTLINLEDAQTNYLRKDDNLAGLVSAATARSNLGLGSVAVESVVPVAKGGTGATTASAARTNLALGAVAIEDVIPVAKGGTGSTSISAARAALGLGTLATKNAAGLDLSLVMSGKSFERATWLRGMGRSPGRAGQMKRMGWSTNPNRSVRNGFREFAWAGPPAEVANHGPDGPPANGNTPAWACA